MNHHVSIFRGFLAALVRLSIAVPAWGQVIHEDRKILANDGTEFDWLGYSIDIDNGIVAMGAIGDDFNGDGAGAAYLFNATSGNQIVKLLPNDGSAGDSFGRSIAIDDGLVAVGAYWDDDNGGNSGSA